MTLSFLRFDRRRERADEYGEFPLRTVKEYETLFRQRLAERAATANLQRSSRNRLALAMGRPNHLASDLVEPELDVYDRDRPDYEKVLDAVLEFHPLLVAKRTGIGALDVEIEAARAMNRPRLSARFEAREFQLEVGNNRDELLGGLRLEVPLASRKIRGARLAELEARRNRLVAERRQLEFELRQSVLDMVLKLEELEFGMNHASVNEEYRQLYADRARTLYEMEVRTDLGDSQARQAEALWLSSKVRYKRAIVWATLDAMQGLPNAILDQANE